MPDAQDLHADLCRSLDIDPAQARITRIGGGDSHPAARLDSGDQRWFIKWNVAERREQFDAEHDALARLAVDGGPLVPAAHGTGSNGAQAWLITEWLDLQPSGDAADFGQRLATLHRQTQDHFGWHAVNFLGASPQNNRLADSWAEFWWSERLAPQFEWASASGLSLNVGLHTIRDASDQLLNHEPRPALVHGDLWGGNHAYLPDGSPVIFDPAPYFGDRETDLAMMRLFGGFHPAVFDAYEKAWPLPPGFEGRLPLYQLYHLLNHYNLFGPGWESRVQHALRAVLQTADRA